MSTSTFTQLLCSEIIPVTIDYVYAYVYIIIWMVCASALSFCFAKRFALCKSCPLLFLQGKCHLVGSYNSSELTRKRLESASREVQKAFPLYTEVLKIASTSRKRPGKVQ